MGLTNSGKHSWDYCISGDVSRDLTSRAWKRESESERVLVRFLSSPEHALGTRNRQVKMLTGLVVEPFAPRYRLERWDESRASFVDVATLEVCADDGGWVDVPAAVPRVGYRLRRERGSAEQESALLEWGQRALERARRVIEMSDVLMLSE